MANDAPNTGAPTRATLLNGLGGPGRPADPDKAAQAVQHLARRIKACARAATYLLAEQQPSFGQAFEQGFAEDISSADIFLQIIEDTTDAIAALGHDFERSALASQREAAHA